MGTWVFSEKWADLCRMQNARHDAVPPAVQQGFCPKADSWVFSEKWADLCRMQNARHDAVPPAVQQGFCRQWHQLKDGVLKDGVLGAMDDNLPHGCQVNLKSPTWRSILGVMPVGEYNSCMLLTCFGGTHSMRRVGCLHRSFSAKTTSTAAWIPRQTV